MSGAAQALIMPPIGAWWLATVVLVPALWVLDDLRGWRALAVGWSMGAASVLGLGYWIAPTAVHFAKLPWIVGLIALLLYAAIFGAYAAVFAWALPPLRRITGAWWPVAAAALWVACEFLNPQLFAHHLGLAFYEVPSIFIATSAAGIGSLSFQIVLCNAVLVEGLRTRSIPWRSGSVALALAALTIAYGHIRAAQIQQAQLVAPKHRIALVQDNLDVAARAALSRQGASTIPEAMAAQTSAALTADPRIEAVVWGESVLEGTPHTAHTRAIRDLVRQHRVELWTGGHDWDDDRRFNAAFRIHGEGVVDRPYRKNVLVPLGEYLPLGERIPTLQRLWGRGRNHPGTEHRAYPTAFGNVSFLICYEAIKSAYVRAVARQQVDLLVNLTYDGWFGDTSCPHLHLAASALQSAQLGVPMVRVSSTGVSAVIDARGVITARTPLFVKSVLVADVPRVTAPSLYAAWGDWFAWTCVAFSLLLLAWAGARHAFGSRS
ncbi:MAG TPA: apolipoprotein N-acyltransferase, partial [Polyangia bacterium]